MRGEGAVEARSSFGLLGFSPRRATTSSARPMTSTPVNR